MTQIREVDKDEVKVIYFVLFLTILMALAIFCSGCATKGGLPTITDTFQGPDGVTHTVVRTDTAAVRDLAALGTDLAQQAIGIAERFESARAARNAAKDDAERAKQQADMDRLQPLYDAVVARIRATPTAPVP